MKKLFVFSIISLLLPLLSFSQILEPVKWSFKVEQSSPDEATLVFTAKADKGWHVYSQDIPPGGPLPTEFIFEENTDYKPIGKVTEPEGHEEMDPNFEIVLKYFDDKVSFKQKIKILSAKDFQVKGYLTFMCCDDTQCLPPTDVDFVFNIKGNPKAVPQDNNQDANNEAVAVPVDETASDNATPVLETEELQFSSNTGDNEKVTESSNNPDASEALDREEEFVSDEKANMDKSLLWFFIISFGAGLLAILTPCVFPMIPMTVTFFMKGSENRRKAKVQAIFYGLSIIVIYTVIGTIVAVTLGANFANFLSTHWIPNIFFFLIFLVFAASFLGMFEITLPNWLVNSADKQADKGGYTGTFFMAFTLVLVSFSCTGPIVGAILVQSAGGKILMPIIGMLGFSLAFAIPFALFAFFPSWLANLPKSGGWLNSVKVVLGFLELALGLKFLSIADQTYHWGILDREVYLALWIVIFTLMGFYLLGKLKFNHDSDIPFISVPRLTLAIITFSFVVYMIPGMFGAPLKFLSGYLPPMSSHDFDLNHIIREEAKAISLGDASHHMDSELCETPKHIEILHLPHGLEGYFDYEQALACAREQNKPLFLDFTGHGCVNCREMEANVWSDPQVLKHLREHYIVVALYVDDKTDLPESEWVTSTYDGKVKKTIGKKYADFQITRFNVNAQPYYVLLDTTGSLLNKPRAYDLDVPEFVNFLEEGLTNFNKE
jgi:thiol:disulfide interchange protein